MSILCTSLKKFILGFFRTTELKRIWLILKINIF